MNVDGTDDNVFGLWWHGHRDINLTRGFGCMKESDKVYGFEADEPRLLQS